MARKHKESKEDLAAMVADMMTSPIIRSNLSFLRAPSAPLPLVQPVVDTNVGSPSTSSATDEKLSKETPTTPPVDTTNGRHNEIGSDTDSTTASDRNAKFGTLQRPVVVSDRGFRLGAATSESVDIQSEVDPPVDTTPHSLRHEENNNAGEVAKIAEDTLHPPVVDTTNGRYKQTPSVNNRHSSRRAAIGAGYIEGTLPSVQPVVNTTNGKSNESVRSEENLGRGNDQLPVYPPSDTTSGQYKQKRSNKSSANTDLPSIQPVVEVSSNAQLPPSRRRKIRALKLAQDGHTANEELIYKLLWDNGSADAGGESKTIAIGLTELARRSRMEYNNCKLLVKKLQAKLTIDLIKEEVLHTSTPRTYRVYSYRAILDRRKARGLIYYVRTPRSIEFVNPDGSPIAPTTGCIDQSPLVTATPPPLVTATVAPPVAITTPPPVAPTGVLVNVLGNTSRKENRETTTTFPGFEQISKSLNKVAYADDAATSRIISLCQGFAPDASASEICHFIETKAEALNSGNIQNPIGFLLVSVPKCFVGEAFIHFREKQRAAKAAGEAQELAERKRREELAEQAVLLLLKPEDLPERAGKIRDEFIEDPFRSLGDFLDAKEWADAQAAWSMVRDQLQAILSPHLFDLWFRPLKGLLRCGRILRVLVPTDMFLHLGDKYQGELQSALELAKQNNVDLGGIEKIEFFSGENFVV